MTKKTLVRPKIIWLLTCPYLMGRVAHDPRLSDPTLSICVLQQLLLRRSDHTTKYSEILTGYIYLGMYFFDFSPIKSQVRNAVEMGIS